MGKKFVQVAALCLALACLMAVGGVVLSGAVPQSASAASYNSAEGERTIKVGLYYGSDALDGAKLENNVGRGYTFGYYDSDDQFVQLGYTDETAIAVVKTENVYYGTYNGYTSYHDCITSNVAVGCYHLQLPGSYYSFDDAFWTASQYSGGFVAYINGSYYARIGNYTARDAAVNAMNELSYQGIATELVGTSAYGMSVVITGTSTIVFQYDDNGSGYGLGVQPVSDTGEKCRTWFKRNSYFGGFRYERINGGDLTVVNFVDLEDYANCVISREMSNSWPLEALKAQAVAARSYAVCLKSHTNYHFDLCSTTHCQAYYGTGSIGDNTAQAVAETAGEFIWYNDGIAQGFYSASNGGASESSSVVWGSNQASYPYLIGVVDPYEAYVAHKIPNYAWTYEYTTADLTARLREKGCDCTQVVNAYVSEYSDVGNPKMVTFVDVSGKQWSMTTRKVVSMLGLPSYNYDFGSGDLPQISINGTETNDGMSGLYAIDGNGNVTAMSEGTYIITSSGITQTSTGNDDVINEKGNFVVSGKGKGHNVGMSQWGASAMAELGYTYVEILQFYYTGVTVG